MYAHGQWRQADVHTHTLAFNPTWNLTALHILWDYVLMQLSYFLIELNQA